MAGRLEQNSSKLILGFLAAGLGLILLFAPVVAGAQTEDYPVTTTPSTTPTSVQRSTVERDPSETGSSTLPRTGSEIAPFAISGLVLVAIGGGIVLLTRRTRTPA